jgi:hypothetical protein
MIYAAEAGKACDPAATLTVRHLHPIQRGTLPLKQVSVFQQTRAIGKETPSPQLQS